MEYSEIPQWKVNLLIKKRLRDQHLKRGDISNSDSLNHQITKISNRRISELEDVTQGHFDFNVGRETLPMKSIDALNKSQMTSQSIANGHVIKNNNEYDAFITGKRSTNLMKWNQPAESSLLPAGKENMEDNVIYEHIIPRAVKQLWLKQESVEESDHVVSSRSRTLSLESKDDDSDGKIQQLDYGNILVSHDVRTMENSERPSPYHPTGNQRTESVSEKQEFSAAAHTWGVKLRHVVTRGLEASPEAESEERNHFSDATLTTNGSPGLNERGSLFQKKTAVDEVTLTASSQHSSHSHDEVKTKPLAKGTALFGSRNSRPEKTSSFSHRQGDDGSLQQAFRPQGKRWDKTSWRWSMPTPVVVNGSVRGSNDSPTIGNNSSNTTSTQNSSNVLVSGVKTLSDVNIAKLSDDETSFRSVRDRRRSFEGILDDGEPTKSKDSGVLSTFRAARLKFSNSEKQDNVEGQAASKVILPVKNNSNIAKRDDYSSLVELKVDDNSKQDAHQLITRPAKSISDSSKTKSSVESKSPANLRSPKFQIKGEAVLLDDTQTSAHFVKEALKNKDVFRQKESSWLKNSSDAKPAEKITTIPQKNAESSFINNLANRDRNNNISDNVKTGDLVFKSFPRVIEEKQQQLSVNADHYKEQDNKERLTTPLTRQANEATINKDSSNKEMNTDIDLVQRNSFHQESKALAILNDDKSSEVKPRRKGLFVIQTGDERDKELANGSRKGLTAKVSQIGEDISTLRANKLTLNLENIPVTRIDEHLSSSEGTSDFFGQKEKAGKYLSFASNSLVKGWEDGSEFPVPEIVFNGPIEDLKSIMNSKGKLSSGKERSKVSFKAESLVTIHSYPSEESLLADNNHGDTTHPGSQPSSADANAHVKREDNHLMPRITSENKPTLEELNGKLQMETPQLPVYSKPNPQNPPSKQDEDSSAISVRYVDDGDFFSESSSTLSGAILF